MGFIKEDKMRKALVVGIDKYSQNPLAGCCNDAEKMADVLSRNGDGSPNFSVRIEKDVQKKETLLRLIKDCFSGNDDIALFYYSGHGYIDSLGGYLVTPDYTADYPGVSLQTVLQIANDSKCRNKVIILDSCCSGFMGNISVAEQNTTIINEGVTILTACKKDGVSIESNGEGIFTSLLVEALSGGAADITGNVTPGGIYAFIDKALGAWEQRPVFKTNVTSFVPLRKVPPQVELSIIRKLCEYFPNDQELLKLDPSFEPTNSKEVAHAVIEPYADEENVKVFSDLQKLEGIGLVVPVGAEHMYFAAMDSKGCKLTSIGRQYWKLVKEEKV